MYSEWPFIDYLLMRMGFGFLWRKQISECNFGVSYLVLVSSSPTHLINAFRGITQGASRLND